MKYFLIEGMIKDADKINDSIMKEHMSYTQKYMDNGMILMSGLKKDMTGGIFIIKSESIEQIETYLSNEPFKLHGVQDYKIIEFNSHYLNQSLKEWFQ